MSIQLNSKKNIRLSDIAQALKLSTSTVSRALAGHPAINEDTRARVREVAASLGYEPQLKATARHGKTPTMTVGVLLSVNELHNRYMTMLLEQIHRDMLEFGYHVMVLLDPINTINDLDHMAVYRPLIENHLDGIILLSVTTDSVILPELQRMSFPVVLAVRSVDNAEVDMVEADNERGGAEIVKHFYELGHRRIGLVMGPENATSSRDRARGALNYLRQKGVPEEDTPVMWNAFTFDSGYSCTAQLLDRPNPVTAIMAASDSIAFGVLEAARSKGVDVPGQLSVAGFDDIPLSGSRLIGLTTIQNRVEGLSRNACLCIIDRIQNRNKNKPSRYVLPVRLVKRETTAVVESR
ncbi:MAG: LacI family transcriptional regulator [Oxalobacteraceae bacterium]|nr:LacI family transcriptional regulator [Oxalobacteraceae bacterium]